MSVSWEENYENCKNIIPKLTSQCYTITAYERKNALNCIYTYLHKVNGSCECSAAERLLWEKRELKNLSLVSA